MFVEIGKKIKVIFLGVIESYGVKVIKILYCYSKKD